MLYNQTSAVLSGRRLQVFEMAMFVRAANQLSLLFKETQYDCVEKDKNTLRKAKMMYKYSLKAVFHFNRIVAKRTVYHCFVKTQAELTTWTQ